MKKIMFVLTAFSMLTLQFCASSKKTAISQPPAKITYLADVQPLVTAHCSPCHIPPKGFKKALDNLDAVKNNIDEILQRINLNPGEKGFMPFKHEKLSDSTIHVFAQWKTDGLLEK